MRLIDADKIRYSDMSDGQVPGGLWYTFKETVDKTPTVKAIPIEWLEKYIWQADTHEEKQALRKMYIVWEKENE